VQLFGTSGVRGVIGEELTSEFFLELGMALGTYLQEKSTVCIGSDSRLSRDMIKASLSAGILSAGVNVTDLGIVPTPVLAFLTKELSFQTGIMITASHNPPQFNGVKLGIHPLLGTRERRKNQLRICTLIRHTEQSPGRGWDS